MPVGIANSKSGFWPGPSSTMVLFIEPVSKVVFVQKFVRQVSKSKREQQIQIPDVPCLQNEKPRDAQSSEG